MRTKKILIILIIITILNNLFTGCVKALTENETITLVKDHTCVSLLKVKGKDMMKTIVYVYYQAPDGTHYPAFCVEPEKNGVGTGAGDSYDVSIKQVSDNVLWRMLYKGYMGSSYQDWNLECDDDLYYATKVAIHSMAEGISPKDKYEVATRVGRFDNLSLEEVQRRSGAVLEVAQSIYDFGYAESQDKNENYISPELRIIKNGSLTEEKINGIEYITQKYTVKATNRELSSYNVQINSFPKGTKIFNNSNVETQGMQNSTFKVGIPKTSILDNITGIINITNAQIKTFPIFYGVSFNPDTQTYVTYADGYETASISTMLDIDAYKSKIIVVKTDSETGEKLEGVTFKAEYEDGTEIGEFTTDKNGEIHITNLKQGRVILTEVNALKQYILDETQKEIIIGYNETFEIELENQIKKGQIEVYKTDEQNREWKLQGVEFQVIDSKDNVVETIVTDENGYAITSKLRVGEYRLKEVKTDKMHILSDEIIKVNVEDEAIYKLEITNKEVPKLPRTGF